MCCFCFFCQILSIFRDKVILCDPVSEESGLFKLEFFSAKFFLSNLSELLLNIFSFGVTSDYMLNMFCSVEVHVWLEQKIIFYADFLDNFFQEK